jgi:hypothetical protein
MIGGFGELARGIGDACIICDVDLQQVRLPAFLRDLIRRLATGITVPRTDENLKSFSRELTRYLVANPLVRSCD